MRLGYSITSAYDRTQPPREAAAGLVDRAEAAATAGIDYVQVGDHHAKATEHYLQNVPMAGRLAAVFDRVATLFLLPLYHPVYVAEYCGTIDSLVDTSDVFLTVGWRDEEFAAFDVPKSERAARFEESLTIVKQLWADDDVTVAGDYFSITNVSINPKADPRICIGGSAEPAVRRAGRMGDAWVGHPGIASEDLSAMIGWFEDAGGGDVILRRDALIREDGTAARDAAARLLEDGYRGWSGDADWLVVGDPEDVAEELSAYRDLGVDEVVVRPMDNSPETMTGLAAAGDLV